MGKYNRFEFKQFTVTQAQSAMKIGTDGVILGAMAGTGCAPLRILDVGTGTGLIALMMAQRFSNATVDALDIDPLAAAEATLNFNYSEFNRRLTCVSCDFLEFDSGSQYDLIVSNPPFFKEDLQSPDFRRAVARHESSLPLDKFFKKGAGLLSSSGTIWVILPVNVVDEARFEASLAGLNCLYECEVSTVESKPPKRVVLAVGFAQAKLVKTTLMIRNANNDYSPEYLLLTKDFYKWI